LCLPAGRQWLVDKEPVRTVTALRHAINRDYSLSMLSTNFASTPFNETLCWDAIDTVLLDMDGTLLDLRFDNYFWLELVPRQYGAARGMDLVAAQAELAPRFAAYHGRLQWYCTDHWSRELDLDIAALKRQARDSICWLPGAQAFLRTLQQWSKRLLLVTNAHHDSLAIKHERTGLGDYFTALVSSHSYGYPKEHAEFWKALQSEHEIAPARTLFIDDSLPVLRAARTHGIAHIVAITHPDSSQPVRECTEFRSVPRVAALLSSPP
jgi:HAD superfamily hydrolase (TIGR01509 family)